MINCLIIAETSVIDTFSKFFKRLPFTLACVATNCEDGLNAISRYNPVVVYIDAEFVQKSIVELNKLRYQCYFIILSDQALNYEKLDSLTFDIMIRKPSLATFLQGFEKFGSFLCQSFLHKFEKEEEDEYFDLKAGDVGLDGYRIRYVDLLYIRSWGNYVHIYDIHGEFTEIRATMKICMEKLPSTAFTRIHNSYIINDQMIYQVKGERVYLIDGQRTQIHIGVSYKQNFLAKHNVKRITNRRI